MSKIKKITAIQIINSRGIPTLKTYVFLDDGVMGFSMVPQGASIGAKEAVEVFDQDEKMFAGFSLKNNIISIETTINETLVGMEIADQKSIDQKLIQLDGTPNKAKLGANTLLSVSLACTRAASLSLKKELFVYLGELSGNKDLHLGTLMFNFINGGAHASNNLEIQEFLVIPKASSFFEAIKIGDEIYLKLKQLIKAKGQGLGLGDEGGFAPTLENNQEAIELIAEAAKASGNGEKIVLGLDAAADNFYQAETNQYKIGGQLITNDQLIAYYKSIAQGLPVKSLEDPMSEDDTIGWQKIKTTFPNLQIVGDDLFVTNPSIIQDKQKLANAIIIKPNQIGTLSETLEAIKIAKKAGMKIIISHRSGETEDTFIADLAVGVGADEVKFGSLARSERLAKYNRLLEIEAFNNLPYKQAL